MQLNSAFCLFYNLFFGHSTRVCQSIKKTLLESLGSGTALQVLAAPLYYAAVGFSLRSLMRGKVVGIWLWVVGLQLTAISLQLIVDLRTHPEGSGQKSTPECFTRIGETIKIIYIGKLPSREGLIVFKLAT